MREATIFRSLHIALQKSATTTRPAHHTRPCLYPPFKLHKYQRPQDIYEIRKLASIYSGEKIWHDMTPSSVECFHEHLGTTQGGRQTLGTGVFPRVQYLANKRHNTDDVLHLGHRALQVSVLLTLEQRNVGATTVAGCMYAKSSE